MARLGRVSLTPVLHLRVAAVLAGHSSRPKTSSSADAIWKKGAVLSGLRSEEFYKHHFLVSVQSTGHGLPPYSCLEAEERQQVHSGCAQRERSLYVSLVFVWIVCEGASLPPIVFSCVMLDLIILNRKDKYGLSPKSIQIR